MPPEPQTGKQDGQASGKIDQKLCAESRLRATAPGDQTDKKGQADGYHKRRQRKAHYVIDDIGQVHGPADFIIGVKHHL